MKDNKKDIPNLKREIKALKSDLDKAILASHEAAGDLIPRLSGLSTYVGTSVFFTHQRLYLTCPNRNIVPILAECDGLIKLRGCQRFFDAGMVASKIAGIKESIQEAMRTFVVCITPTLFVIISADFGKYDNSLATYRSRAASKIYKMTASVISFAPNLYLTLSFFSGKVGN